MSVRSEVAPIATPAADMQAALAETTPADAHLGEGQSYSVATPENPLHRQLVVSVRTSLNELCLNKQKGTWAPSGDALKAIFQCAHAQTPESAPWNPAFTRLPAHIRVPFVHRCFASAGRSASPPSTAPRSRWAVRV